jgi:hypothetical protein
MGDKTTVEFYVRSTKIPKEFMDDTDECNIEGNITYLSQDEANYGSWEELEEYLKDNKIDESLKEKVKSIIARLAD